MKKIISIFLSIALLSTSAVSAAPAVDKGEKVTLIVEVEGASLLETKNAAVLGASEFMKTTEAKTTETRILSAQSKVKSDIEKKVHANADKGFTYTSVFNGFSMEAYTSDIEKIKAADGVKNVYISQTYKIPDDKISDEPAMLFDDTYDDRVSADMMNVRYMYDLDYDGRGQAVAIIDSEFDTAHEFFASDVIDPKFSKSDIKAFLENNELNINASVNQVYKNSKIPFAYDYGEGDADTYSAVNIHGSHVAGIAGGKNGNYYGNVFSCMAPEVQLILMKVVNKAGEFSYDAILAALDDVSKTDICAVNCSFGENVIISELYTKILENLRNTGIVVIVAAGNSDRASETPDNPDYAYPMLPAGEPCTTSVASVDSDILWVLDNTITLGNGEVLEYEAEDLGKFFEGFSDKFYEYVILNDISDIKKNDMNGKIGVYPDTIAGSDIETALHDAGALGRIVIMSGESDSVSGFRLDLRAAAVKRSSGEKLIACEEKTLKTTPGTKHYKKRADSGMSSFTSWGTSTKLELKPEITAPGGNILSSVPDDEYRSMNGTSMAAPQITGAAALLNGFIEDNYPYVTGADRVALTENLLMSSANIMFQDEEKTLPESPRRQGAGLADLEAAAKIPVILKGDSGKSKLSLYDMLGDEITLKFTAENLTYDPVTYDDIRLYVFTDNYENQDGVNYITDSVPLEFTFDAKESYTIPGYSEEEITITINLDQEQTAENLKIFTNGFFIDGFIVLGSADGSVPKTSMPFTGFYGDWTAFPAIAPTYFEENSGNGGLYGVYEDSQPFLLGSNLILNKLFNSGIYSEENYSKDEYESPDFAGYSSNSRDVYTMLRFCMRRGLTDLTVRIHDADGNLVFYDTEPLFSINRKDDFQYDTVAFPQLNLPDGDYTLKFSGRLAYADPRSRSEEKSFKFYTDSLYPEVSKTRIYEEDGRKYAAFSASDNRHLMGAQAFDGDKEIGAIPVKALQNANFVFDVTDADPENLKFIVTDYALNSVVFDIGNIYAEIIEKPVKIGNSLMFRLSVSNTGEAADTDIIAALYSADNELIDVDIKHQSLSNGQHIIRSFDFNNTANASYVKIFMWKHGEMIPLIDAIELILP